MSNFFDEGDRLVGADTVETWDAVWWCANDAEVEALNDAGFPQALAIVGNPEVVFRQYADHLAELKQITLAMPTTPDGLRFREKLAARFGRHRCSLVKWPAGADSATQTLALFTRQHLIDALQAAEPYPIEGVQQVKPGTLQALRDQSAPGVMSTGATATDNVVMLPTEGRLIVVTGWPGSGKTNWVRFVMVHTAAKHDRRWLVFSPEMQPWESFMAETAEVLKGKPFWPKGGVDGLTEVEILEAERWLSDRIFMLVSDAQDKPPTVDWLLDRGVDAKMRYGITDFLWDPWNEIDHTRAPGISETDWIGRCLQRAKAFGLRHGVNIWIIAHPAKPPPIKPGEKRGAPGPYEISGSSHWANKSDVGLTVHSPEAGKAEVINWKTRYRRWKPRGGVAKLDFDELIGRYRTEIPAAKAEATPKAAPPPGLFDDGD